MKSFSASLRSVPKTSVLGPIFLRSVFSKVGIAELDDWKPYNSPIIRDADRVIISNLNESEEFCSIELLYGALFGLYRNCPLVLRCLANCWFVTDERAERYGASRRKKPGACLGAQRIPDPTTSGDFTRRFEEADILNLMEITKHGAATGLETQLRGFLREAFIDTDGTIAPTLGECKGGMALSYKGIWGYAPLLSP